MVEDTDKYVVERDGTLYTVAKEDVSNIAPDDLFVIHRDGVDYSITGAIFLEEGGGGGTNNPDKLDPEENSDVYPKYAGGSGTLADPYILTANPANLGGQTLSQQLITIFGLKPGTAITIVDTDTSVNGDRFKQPTLVATNGYTNFRMEFFDWPETVGGGDYSAILNIGEIYWKWDVTVLPNGIQRPTIDEVLGQDGSYYPPIQGPDFTPSPLPASEVIPAVTFSGLTPDTTVTDLPATNVTGTGAGLTVDARTEADGTMRYIIINEPGDGYLFDDEVTVDLSSIGGDPATSLTIYTEPVSAPSITFKVSPYISVESGDFLNMEWWIGTDPTWKEGSYSEYDITTESTNPTVVTTLPTGSVWYAKFRYISQEQVYSHWSQTCKGGMFASFRNFSYIIANQDLLANGKSGRWQSFESSDINIEKRPGTYFTYITQAKGIISGHERGSACNPGTQWGSTGPGYPNETNAHVVWIQTRQPLNLSVDNVDSFGNVTAVTQLNWPIGLPDYFLNRSVDTSTNNAGTGYKCTVNRINGVTTWLSTDAGGAGYSIGDTITFTPPFGHGGNGDVQTVSGFNQGWTDINVSHSTLTMDSEHDIFLQGIGSTGGKGGSASSGGGAGGVQSWLGSYNGSKGTDQNNGNNPGGTGGVAGVETPNDIYPARGDSAGGCYSPAGWATGSGGAGGAGWGGGNRGGQGLAGSDYRPGGGGGGSGYSKVNTLYIPEPLDCLTSNTFAKAECYLLIGGEEVTVGKDFYYKLY